MENKELKVYISLVSGDVYYIEPDEVKNLDQFQIPLVSKPKFCKKCYGRGYIGTISGGSMKVLCRCIMKFIDYSALKKDVNLPDIKFQV